MTYYRRPNVEKGTNRDDVINGTNRKDIVFAKNGDDIINTGGGNDIIYAGKGDDIIHAGSGNDLVFAGSGDDVVFAGSGWDEVYGGRGNDTVFGGSGNDLIFGDKGDDQLFGESGRDVLLGGKGDDTLSGGTGNDILVGGSGCDTAVFDDSIFNFRFFDLGFFGFYVVHDGELDIDALFGIEKLQFDDFTVFIDGRNNAPFAFDDEAATDADMVLTVPGEQLLNNDFDFDGDDLTIVSVDDTNTLGTVTLNAAGEVVYDTNGQFNFLNVGQTDIDTFEYTVSDGNGGFDTALVTVTITGVNNNNNNAPDAVDDMATTDEDTAVDINVLDNDLDIDNDTLTIIQVDGQAISEGQSVTISSGAIVSLAGGLLNYDPAGQFEALGVGEATTDSFTYTISDGNGGSDMATVNINIDGVNDAPVANDDLLVTDEDNPVAAIITQNDTDVDGDNVEIVSVDDSGLQGTIVVDADNDTITYDPNGQFEFLAVGEMATETFTYTITDGNGGTDSATVTVTINGVNDAPVAVDDTNAAADDGVAVTGNVLDNDSDVDTSDVLSVANAGTLIGAFGTLTLNADGSYSYIVTDESIDDGFTGVDSFSIDVTDGTDTVTSTLNIDITGFNDAPVAVDDSNAAADDGVAVTGNVLDNDIEVDAGDTLSVVNAGTLIGTFGTLTLNADGSYSYIVTDESIDDGFTGVDSFSIDVTDGTDTVASTLNIDITGLNDAPVAVDDTNAAADDGVAVTGNVLDNDSDVDAGDVLTVANAGIVIGTFGTLTLNTDGSYSYIVTDESIDDGFTGVDSFSIDVTDGTETVTSTLNIDITGLNDAPVAVDDTNAAADDGVAVGGNVLDNDSDVDAGDVLSVANAGSFMGVYGTLTLNSDGTYSYIVTDESIDDGFTDVDTFSVDVTDGTATVTSTLTIDITGLNDAPVAVDDINAAADDGVAVGGNVLDNDSDVDAGDVLSVANAGSFMGVYGTLTLNSDGTYSYIVTDESIDDGFTDVDTFSVDVTDGTATVTSTLTIDITGLNDAPVAVDDTNAAADDGVAVTGNVLDNDNDVDAGDVLSVANAGTLIGTFGTLTLNSDGTYSYVVTDESIDDGFTGVDSFAIDVTDGTDTVTSSLDIDITGLNDAPVAVDDSDDAADDGVVATGNVLDNDIEVDALDQLTVANAGTFIGVYGTLMLNTDGSYSYIVTDESIPEGFTDVDTFSVDVTDGTETDTSTLTINITGLNDNPDAMDDLFTIGESQSASGNLLANDVDVDTGDVLTVTDIDGNPPGTFTVTSVGGRTGTVTFAADGTFTFSTDGNFEDLNDDDSDVVRLTYSITDDAPTAGTDRADILITINGENDNVAPDAVDDVFATTEDVAINLNVLDNDNDANFDLLNIIQVDGQNISVGGSVTLTVSGATVTLNGDGSLTYDPSGVFDFLAQDDVTSDVFSYTISDGELTDTAFVDVEITGINDAPVAADQNLSVFEGIGITISSIGNGDFFFNATDVDGAIASVFQVDGVMDGATGITTDFGTLTWDPANGLFTYAVNDANPTVHNLVDGVSLTDTFSFSLLDDFGAESNTATLTVTIDGVNDGLFTEQSDGVNLSTAVEAFPETAFENNFLNAFGGDDFVILVSGNENSLYLDEFDGQTFNGNGGDDTISMITAFMNADGNAGIDTIDFSLSAEAVTYSLATGEVDFGRNNSTDATAVNFENAFGSDFDDLIIHSTDANFINGGAGDDTFNLVAGIDATLDTFVGGAGNDTLFNTTGANFTLATFNAQDPTGLLNGSGIEAIRFEGRTLLGNESGNDFDFTGVALTRISISTGNIPTVSTLGGDDIVRATDQVGSNTSNGNPQTSFRYDLGDGDDTFFGALTIPQDINGNDLPISDLVFGGDGNDTIFGGAGNDIFEGDAGADVIDGGDGDDLFNVRADEQSELDTYIGGDGFDTVFNLAANNFIFSVFDGTATGNVNGNGIESLRLEGRTMFGTEDANLFNFTGVLLTRISISTNNIPTVSTLGGDDTVFGTDLVGSNTSNGNPQSIFRYDLGEGDDMFTGALTIPQDINGNDLPIVDFVFGDAGVDLLDGGAGNDILNGGADNDTVLGNIGDDSLDGGLGTDLVRGGAGDDRIIMTSVTDHSSEVYIGGDDFDTLVNSIGNAFTLNLINATGAGGEINVSEIEAIQFEGRSLLGTSGDDIFDFTDVQFLRISISITSVPTVSTGAGNDVVTASAVAGSNTSNGNPQTIFRYILGEGNDTFTGLGNVVRNDVLAGEGDDTLVGADTLAGDILEGGAGIDLIDGAGGDDDLIIRSFDDSEFDTYIGGSGFDEIINSSGANFIFDGFDGTASGNVNGNGIEAIRFEGRTLLGNESGNDFDFTGVALTRISISTGNIPTVSTLGGDDIVRATDQVGSNTSNGNPQTSFRYDLGDGDDTFFGALTIPQDINGNDLPISDLVFGGDGNDTIFGGAGNDIFEGDAGADVIDGGDGDDLFNVRADEQSELDTYIGGDGFDTVFNLAANNFIFSVFDGTATGNVNGNGIESLRLEGRTMFGTEDANLFNFTGVLLTRISISTNNIPTVSTLGGDDTVFGTDLVGSNTSNGNPQSIFRYDLGEGDDMFTGALTIPQDINGNDLPIVDFVFGDAGVDLLDGGAGNDILNGGADNDTVLGNIGDDSLDGGLGTDLVRGGAGDDRIIMTSVTDHSSEVYIGGDDFDTLVNSIGNAFTLNLINATGAGGEINVSEIEAIQFEGRSLLGTSGDDIFDFTDVQFLRISISITSVPTVSTGAGNDVVTASAVAGSNTSNGNPQTIFRYILGEGNDTFTGLGNVVRNDVLAGEGDDTLVGADTLAGDILEGGAGIDLIDGAGGDDDLIIRSFDDSEFDTYIGGSGFDEIINSSGANFIFDGFDGTASGNVNGNGIEAIRFEGRTLLGNESGNDFDFTGVALTRISISTGNIPTVSTLGGDDIVRATDQVGSNTSNGNPQTSFRYDLGDGDDTFFDGIGINDLIRGDSGNDTYVFGDDAGTDTILDFEQGADLIDLSAVTEITDFSDLVNGGHLVDQGNDTLITDGQGTNIILTGIADPAQLVEADFIF